MPFRNYCGPQFMVYFALKLNLDRMYRTGAPVATVALTVSLGKFGVDDASTEDCHNVFELLIKPSALNPSNVDN